MLSLVLYPPHTNSTFYWKTLTNLLSFHPPLAQDFLQYSIVVDNHCIKSAVINIEVNIQGCFRLTFLCFFFHFVTFIIYFYLYKKKQMNFNQVWFLAHVREMRRKAEEKIFIECQTMRSYRYKKCHSVFRSSSLTRSDQLGGKLQLEPVKYMWRNKLTTEKR